MTKLEKKLAARLLDIASDQFSNHGCNDFDLKAVMPNVKDRRALAMSMHEDNGDPEEFDPKCSYDNMPDWWLMSYLSQKLKREA